MSRQTSPRTPDPADSRAGESRIEPGTRVERLTTARLPTRTAEFVLQLFRRPGDPADHLALVLGDVAGRDDVLVRVHSECLTGDVLGSTRCDCGQQLDTAMQLVAEEGRGVLLYLRQEGRGIGLLQKLRAYNLQDAGYDTVEANLELGHQADERDYGVAVGMLRELGVRSIRLLTNNPHKIESLIEGGFEGVRREPLEVPANAENAGYLETKVRRMRHLLSLDRLIDGSRVESGDLDERGDAAWLLRIAQDGVAWPSSAEPARRRPFVTLAYAQSLDGSITMERGRSMVLSGPEALDLTHGLRARHDGILVGIETVLADDPRLTVRRVEGPDPRPVVLDSRLRIPADCELMRGGGPAPWVATTHAADRKREARLERLGAKVVRVGVDDEGRVDLEELMPLLLERGFESLMVEGGARVLTSFLRRQIVDKLVVTIAPVLVGGLGAVGPLRSMPEFPRLKAPVCRWVGGNLVVVSELESPADVDDEVLVWSDVDASAL